MRATMSVLGLYNYDNTVLDNIRLNLPQGVEIEALRFCILQNCAELEVLITNPEIFKRLVTAWSFRKRLVWQRYYNAINTVYSPLENYDRQEQETFQEAGTNSNEAGTTTTNAEQEAATRTPNLTDENKVAGFNSSTYAPQSESLHTGTETNNAARNTSGSVDTETSGEYGRSYNRSGRIHGNIGVTTSQQMLASELDLTPRLDIYEYIMQDFKREFCILVY